MPFKSREDIYTTKTFENAEEAATFVTAIASSFKQQGYKVAEMNVRESYGYGPMPMKLDEEEDRPSMYVGTVGAYKETEKPQQEDKPTEAKVN